MLMLERVSQYLKNFVTYWLRIAPVTQMTAISSSANIATRSMCFAFSLMFLSTLVPTVSNAQKVSPLKLQEDQERLTRWYDAPWYSRVYPRNVGKRYIPKLISDLADTNICRVYLQNEMLWGGSLNGECNLPQLNAKLKDKKEFQFFSWTPLDPAQNRELIRKIISSAPLTLPSGRQLTQSDLIWKEMRPVIEDLISKKRLKLQRAEIDLMNSGIPKLVYGVSLLPADECLNHDQTPGVDFSYIYVNGDTAAERAANNWGLGGAVFQYLGKTYSANASAIWQSSSNDPDALGKPFSNLGICQFQDH